MKFSIKAMKDDEGTFSAEGVYAFLSHYIDWTNKTFSQILAHGFKTGEVVKELVIETSWTVNGKPVSEEVLDEICKGYPEYKGFNKTKLLEMFLEELRGKKAVEDEQHRFTTHIRKK